MKERLRELFAADPELVNATHPNLVSPAVSHCPMMKTKLPI